MGAHAHAHTVHARPHTQVHTHRYANTYTHQCTHTQVHKQLHTLTHWVMPPLRAPSALPLKAERHPNTKHQSYSDPRSPPAPAPAPAPPPSYRWVRRPPRSQAPYAPPLSSWTPPTTAAHTVQRLHLHCLPLPTRHHRQGASPRRIVQRTLDPPAFNNTHSVWCTHTHSAAHLHPHCLSPRHIMQWTHDPLASNNTHSVWCTHTHAQCSTSTSALPESTPHHAADARFTCIQHAHSVWCTHTHTVQHIYIRTA